jgi:type 1 fimbria pilin
MRNVTYIAGICGMAIALSGAQAQAQDIRIVHFSGVINDYSPSTVAGGPYEIRGDWSVDLQRTGTANFSADLNMETSDYGITDATAVDPTNPATRSPHTHHISMTNATVSYDTSVCPANTPPTTGTGVVVTGTATTSGNGSPASFESKGASTIQLCIMGGSEVDFSNITLVYTGPATGHFGPQPIHGVVRSVSTR